MNERDFEELSAGQALHALSPEDQRALREVTQQDPESAAHAADDAATAARLADAVSEVAPPPRIRSELLARIAAEPNRPDAPGLAAGEQAAGEQAATQRAAEGEPQQRRGGRAPWGARAWFTLAASMVLLAGAGVGAVLAAQWFDRPAAVVALDRIEDAPDARTASAPVTGGGEAILHWSVELGEAVLVSERLPEIGADRQFELWYVRSDEAIPAGVFDAEDARSTGALLEEGMQPGDVIAVTVEEHGGSPTGTPTTDPIVAIATD
ncbi:anti-sigma factor [Microbacterium sp. JZ31]|uniref:anti-sigma factor n=1 Tax=Microbacterium sp. JZ31 TaxID=1906274 RepID=UPI001932516A|nr:anti-sigma factor [Microbacterium sp. JZ31]